MGGGGKGCGQKEEVDKRNAGASKGRKKQQQ